MKKANFTFHNQYFFFRHHILFSRNAKETHTDQSILQCFFLSLKRKDSQTFKRSRRKKIFSSVYVIGTTCFDECFLLHVITGKHHFSQKYFVALKFFNRLILWKYVFLLICVKTEVRYCNRIFMLQHHRQPDDTYINNDYINAINSINQGIVGTIYRPFLFHTLLNVSQHKFQ